MKNKTANKEISAELLAAFLDGNATWQESQQIVDSLVEDAQVRELLRISQTVDAELGMMPRACDFIPMTAMAATCDEGSYCSLECEKYVLRTMGITFDEQQLLANAIANGWQKEGGTALHNVGRHLENEGLVVVRRYGCRVEEIAEAVEAGCGVIAAVDGGELLGNRAEERAEDVFVGPQPDHTVVVVSLDAEGKTITLFDPNSTNAEDTYPIEQFNDAWNDSKNYLVTINPKDMNTYIPKPIDLSDVELPEELNELREAIAENAHEVWALNRWNEGWRYGPERDDTNRLHPDMIPYSQLTDGEKEYDRQMAINTIKLLTKLGYDITKRTNK